VKAAIFRGGDMVVDTLPPPEPKQGQALVKVLACGICGSDLHAVQHGFGLRPGSVMGHEFCGEIVELGPGVSGYAEGERVTSLPYIGCGTCEFCRKGQGIHCENIRGLGLGQLPGAYAEYVMCGARSLFKLPAGVDSRLGAMVEPLSVGLHGVKRAGLGRGAVPGHVPRRERAVGEGTRLRRVPRRSEPRPTSPSNRCLRHCRR